MFWLTLAAAEITIKVSRTGHQKAGGVLGKFDASAKFVGMVFCPIAPIWTWSWVNKVFEKPMYRQLGRGDQDKPLAAARKR
jgi:hypothetical protein